MPVSRLSRGSGGEPGPAGATGPAGAKGATGPIGPEGAAGAAANLANIAAGGLYKSRTLAAATAFKPAASQAAYVICSPKITVANGANGAVTVAVGPVASMVEIASIENKLLDADVVNAKSVLNQMAMSFIVPAGHAYEVKTQTLLGVPVFALGSAFEILL